MREGVIQVVPIPREPARASIGLPKGNRLTDRTLAQRLGAALEKTPEVDAATVQPEVRNRVVELRGTVSSLSVRCAAELAAWSVGGVVNVVNRLRVAASAASPNDLARQLEADLCACLGLAPTSITVAVHGNTVSLEGIVPSPYHRLAAEDLVRSHEVVHDVVNSLAVTGTAESPPRDTPGVMAEEAPQAVSKVYERGQTVVPKRIREALAIEQGAHLQWQVHGGVIHVVPIPREPVQASVGLLKGKGLTFSRFLRDRNEERRREREREAREQKQWPTSSIRRRS